MSDLPDSLVHQPSCSTLVISSLICRLQLLWGGDGGSNTLAGQLGLNEGEDIATGSWAVMEDHTCVQKEEEKKESHVVEPFYSILGVGPH